MRYGMDDSYNEASNARNNHTGRDGQDDSRYENSGDRMRDDSYERRMHEAAREQAQVRQYSRQAFIIPSCSSWFDFNQIHELEMQSLPEFFCGKYPHKNPTSYLNFRNSIIKMYREKPTDYLSAFECRKRLPGDVCSIFRLHAFLE